MAVSGSRPSKIKTADEAADELDQGDEQGAEELTQPPADHPLAHPSRWPWLPKLDHGDLAPHPYREDTGEVMAVGGARALDHGGLVNLLANLKRRLRQEGLVMTDVQRRLILKTIQERELDDPFSLTRETQFEKLCEVAAKYLGLHEETVASYLRAC